MILKMNGPFRVDNLRGYSSETVETLRSALVVGVTATADTHRRNFYDLEAGDDIFYIHLSPTGTVLLLARWRKQPAQQVIPYEEPLAELAAYC
jgi:hypothetical protein